MTDTIQYGMGQVRYTNTSTYMSPCNFNYEPINVLVSSDNAQDVYQDVLLRKSGFSFDPNTSYLLKITIPKDLNYNNTYRVKMVASPNNIVSTLDPDNVTYQMLKYINVPKEIDSSNSSRVIIYPIKNNGDLGINEDGTYETKVAIALDKDSTPVAVNNVYFDNNRYYIYILDDNDEIVYQEIQNKNDVILNHVWTSGHSTTGVDFNFIFTPRDSDETYNQIWIEMFRESYDQDIYSDGIYGRKIDLDSNIFQVEVYELQNLIGWGNGISDVSTLTHIGVYSHPNTIMAINGEEIRVGQSGYYELNNFEITSFGIAAEDDDDKFIIDYQYQVITS